MRIILTEEQLKNIVLDHYDRDRVYIRKRIFNQLKGAPGYIWRYTKGLPRFYMYDENGNPYTDENGEKVVFTKIPEVLYVYLYGNF